MEDRQALHPRVIDGLHPYTEANKMAKNEFEDIVVPKQARDGSLILLGIRHPEGGPPSGDQPVKVAFASGETIVVTTSGAFWPRDKREQEVARLLLQYAGKGIRCRLEAAPATNVDARIREILDGLS